MKQTEAKILVALLFILASITIIQSCQKTDRAEFTPFPVTPVTASVAGLVIDLNNIPVANALVTAGGASTVTDADGLFSLKNVQLNKDAGFVEISKTGFFTGSRTFLVNANTVSHVKIQLIPKTISGEFDAASGGDVNISGGGLVNVGANNIVYATGSTAYTDKVYVSTFYLNPVDVNFNEYMPGVLRGLDDGNQQKVLQSFGMVSVEMNDAAGEKLQIAKGKTATVTIPIPSVMQSNAPSSIPLWYFDGTIGIWKREGSATKQGNNYVGTVTHFSFWTAGQLGQSIRLDATFKDQAGIPLSNILVTITSTNYGASKGYTDSTGVLSGLIPANESLLMELFDQCNNSLYEQNIGPYSIDHDLGTIAVTVAVNCTSSSQYIKFILHGLQYTWSPPDLISAVHTDTSGGGGVNNTLIQGQNANNIYFYILNDNASPGVYNISTSIFINGKSYTDSASTTTVTEYGPVGGYISGSASGYIKELDSISNTPFSMLYYVKRTQ